MHTGTHPGVLNNIHISSAAPVPAMTKTAQGFWRATITFIGMAVAHKRAIRTAYTLTFLRAWIISLQLAQNQLPDLIHT